ncbi:MAG: hypothetical protein ACI8QC_004537, partial [Planctomycetota bacterium]
MAMDKSKKRAQKDKKRKAAQLAAAQRPPAPNPQLVSQALKESHELMKQGQPEKADKLLRRALKGAPDDTKLLTNLANALERQGLHTEALGAIRRCTTKHPSDGDSHNNLGALLKFSGDLEEAESAFRRAVELAPRHADAWRNLASVKTFATADDPDLVAMLKLLDFMALTDNARIPMHFALGKAFEEIGEDDTAWFHYEKGNRMRRARMTYNSADLAEVVDRTIASQGKSFLDPGPVRGASDAAPILVVGMPRSGSSLVEQILASHADVSGVGEAPDLARILSLGIPDARERVDAVANLPEEEIAALGASYAATLAARAPNAKRVVDKYLTNFLQVGFLHRALPNARIVYCQRDPMDNAFACLKVLFTTGVQYVYDQKEVGQALRLHQQMLDHWLEHIPDNVLVLSYEELVADQEAQTRRLLDFAGLEWDPACLEFHNTRRRVASASSTQ